MKSFLLAKPFKEQRITPLRSSTFSVVDDERMEVDGNKSEKIQDLVVKVGFIGYFDVHVNRNFRCSSDKCRLVGISSEVTTTNSVVPSGLSVKNIPRKFNCWESNLTQLCHSRYELS